MNLESNPKIEQRLKEFAILHQQGNDEWFSELCFCILTANSQAKRAIAIQQELGAEGLWDEKRCSRLVSYIFIQKFDKILTANRPLIDKVMGIKMLRSLFTPVVAIICLILFVLDIVVLTDRGNWFRIPRFVLTVGTIILASFFFGEIFQFFGTGGAVIVSISAIIWNHVKLIMESEKKEKKRRR